MSKATETANRKQGSTAARRLSPKFAILSFLVLLVATTGASCPRGFRGSAPPLPIVFSEQPSLSQIIHVVNSNTDRVRELQTQSAKLVIHGAPGMQAALALERPRRLRLRAETTLTGAELDMGSNDEVFWMWAKRNDPQGVYFARHDQFRPGVASGMLPLPPSWLIEALGLITMDPSTAYDGPRVTQTGEVELSYITNGNVPLMKKIVIDAQHGVVQEQRVYDQSGTLIASAQMSDHRFDATTAVTLPHTIVVKLPTIQLAFTFQVDGYQVNDLSSDPMTLWAMPRLDTPYHDLAVAPGNPAM